MKVELNIDKEIPELDLKLILREALCEFLWKRSNPSDYVKEQYPYQSEMFILSHKEAVRQRNAWASLIYAALCDLKITK